MIIIDRNDHLLPKDDPEVWNVMKKVLKEDGVKLCLKCRVKSVLQTGKMISTEEFLEQNRPAMQTVEGVLNVAMMLETQALDLYLRYSQKIKSDLTI